MGTTLSFSANTTANLVLYPADGVLRVAASSSGLAGTFTFPGTPTGAVSWTLTGAPTGGHFTLTKATASTATLSFSGVPQRTEPYVLLVKATDGSTVYHMCLTVVVRPALILSQITTGSQVSGNTVTGAAYDASLPSLEFRGMGGGVALTDVQWIAPDQASMPTGLTFQVTDAATAKFAVDLASPEDPAGGIHSETEAWVFSFQAYHPDTLYDSPENALSVDVTYNLTASTSADLHAGLGAVVDPTTGSVYLDLDVFYKGGKARPYTTSWSVSSGASGTWSGGQPATNALSAVWQPNGDTVQNVVFTVKVTDGVSTITLTTESIAVSAAESWVGSTALPVTISQGTRIHQDAGKKVWLKVDLADLQPTESATVALTVVPLPLDPGETSHLTYTQTVRAGAADKTLLFAVPIPTTTAMNQMWEYRVTAATSSSVLTARKGYAQVLVVCEGAPSLVVTPVASSANLTTGQPASLGVGVATWAQQALSEAQVRALAPAALTQFLSSTPNTVNSSLTSIGSAALSLTGAPTGLRVSDGEVVGLPVSAGSFSSVVTASAPGYRPASSPVTLTCTNADGQTSPFASFVSAPTASVSADTALITWSVTGAPTSIQVHGLSSSDATNVLMAWASTGDAPPTSLAVPLSGVTGVEVLLRNAVGTTYSHPIVAQPAATTSSAIPVSPVTAVIDSTNRLNLQWVPPAIDGVTYGYWTLSVKDSATALSYDTAAFYMGPASADGTVPGPGSASTYSMALDGNPGYLALEMHAFYAGSNVESTEAAWGEFKAFPGIRSAIVSKTQVDREEPVTLTLGSVLDSSTGVEGDRWYVDFGDGTRSNDMPVSLTSIAKAYTTAGEKIVTIYVISDYVIGDGTKVSLSRVHAFPSNVVVTSSVYRSNILANPAQSDYNVSGSDGVVPSPAKFEVVVPFVVRDESTNELMLGVATSRNSDASSQLGTMSADIFALAGRPHTLDLVDVVSAATAADQATYDPLVITSTALEDAVAGQPLNPFQLQAKGGLTPYKWFARELPQGLTLTRDGVLTGSSTGVGDFAVTISVQDSQSPAYIAEKTLTLYVSKSDVAIAGVTDANGNSVSALPDAVVGSHFVAYVTAKKGVAPYSWSLLAGSLPHGVTLDTATGRISGWPSTINSTSEFDTVFTPTFEVTDAVGASASAAFPISLKPMALGFAFPDQTKVTAGQATVVNIPIVGGRPGYTLYGATPVVSSPDSGFVGAYSLIDGVVRLTISPTFLPSAAINESITITVADSTGATKTSAFTFTVLPATNNFPVWPSASFPAKVTQTLRNDDEVTLTGVNAATDFVQALDMLPAAPTGISTSVLSNNTEVALLKVDDTVTRGTNADVTLRALIVRNGYQYGMASRTYCIASYVTSNDVALFDVHPAPTYLSESFAFDIQVAGRNAPDPAIPFASAALVTGSSLPLGVSLDATSGVVYGAAQSTAVTTSQVELLDGAGKVVAVATIYWSLVDNALVLSPTASVANGSVGAPYTLTLVVAGTGTYTLASASLMAGRLPKGLTLTTVDGSTTQLPRVIITGSPLEYGTFDLVIRAVDGVDSSVQGIYKTRLVVTPQAYLNLVTSTLPTIISGVTYSSTLIATGGVAPYTWGVVTAGGLPNGIHLNPATGEIAGSTNVVGFDQPTVFQVTDANGQISQATITVVADQAQPLDIVTPSVPTATVGGAYNTIFEALGGVAPYTWSCSPGTINGLTVDQDGVLKGTPTGAFTGTLTVKVTDSAASPVTVAKDFALTIVASGTPLITPVPAPLPVGNVGVAYGTTAVRTGLGMGATSSLTTTPYKLAWHVAETLTLGSATVAIALGGFRRPYSSTFDLSARTQVTAAPLYTFLSGGTATGVVPNLGDSPVLITNNHMLAASVAISATEIFVVGGVGNDPQGGSLGVTLNQAFIQAFKMGDGDIPTPDGRYLVNNTGTSTLPVTATDTVTLRRHGHSACKLTDTSILVCGGMAFSAAGVRDMSVDSKAVYVLTFTRDGNGNPTGFTWDRKASMPVGLVFHKAVALNDGRVLVIGGVPDLQAESSSWSPAPNAQGSNICLIYTPSTDTWAFGASLPIQVFSVAAATLPNGQVLISAPSDLPNATDTGNLVDGIALSAVNCMQIFTPSAGGPGSWAPWASFTEGTPSTDIYRGMARPGTTLHVRPDTGSAHTIGGENALTGLMGNLFSHALVTVGATVTNVYSNPQSSRWRYITNAVVPTGVYLVASNGVAPYHSWSVSPALPDGMTLDPDTGEIYGTPLAGTSASYTFSVKDSRAGGSVTGSQALTLTVDDPGAPIWDLSKYTASTVEGPYDTTGVLGGTSFYSQSLMTCVTDGYTSVADSFTFSIASGALPGGITLNGTTGLLSGTPTLPGVYNFAVTATNTVASPSGRYVNSTKPLTLTVNGFIFLTPGSQSSQTYNPGLPGHQTTRAASTTALPDALIGSSYSQTMTALNGTAPYTWSITGLPSGCGLTFSGNSTGSAVIAGTSTSLSSSSTPFSYTMTPTVKVTDANGVTQQVTFSLEVGEKPLSLSSTVLANVTVGSYTSQSVTLSGGVGPYTLKSYTGVPEGLSLAFNGTTGLITVSGTPTVNAKGAKTVAMTFADSGAIQTTLSLTFTVNAKAYTWSSGAYAACGAWPSDGKSSPMKIGILWSRFMDKGYGSALLHSDDGKAFQIRVTGVFTTATPGMTLTSAGGVGWVASLIKAPVVGSSSTAVFGVTATGYLSNFGSDLTMTATLVDTVATDVATVSVATRAASGPIFTRPNDSRTSRNVLETPSGTKIAATTYSG